MANKVKLTDSDWQVLFPQRIFVLGNTTLFLTPLSLLGLSKVIAQVNPVVSQIEKLGIPLAQLTDSTQNIITLVSIILKDAPGILSELAGLEESDVASLPLAVAVNLFSECLDLNLSSQEGLLKNFKRLGEKVAQMTMNPLQ